MNIFQGLLVLSVGGLVVLCGCQTDSAPPLLEVSYPVGTETPVLVQTFAVSGVTQEAVKNAIVTSARAREWSVTSEQPNAVTCNLVHRRYDSTLMFKFDSNHVEIHSLSYKTDKSGNREERDEPEGWIRNLHKDILTRLGLPTGS